MRQSFSINWHRVVGRASDLALANQRVDHVARVGIQGQTRGCAGAEIRSRMAAGMLDAGVDMGGLRPKRRDKLLTTARLRGKSAAYGRMQKRLTAPD
jgi:hypothetical protein